MNRGQNVWKTEKRLRNRKDEKIIVGKKGQTTQSAPSSHPGDSMDGLLRMSSIVIDVLMTRLSQHW